MTGRVTIAEVVAARRSLAVGRLPIDVETRLLDELERLVREREQLLDLVARLRSPFGDVRQVLNDVDELLRR